MIELLLLLIPFLVSICLIYLLGNMMRRFPMKADIWVFVAISTLMLTPSLLPGTIPLPAPFGQLLLFDLLFGDLIDAKEQVLLFWKWHLTTFPLTALCSYLIARRWLNRSSNIEPSSLG